MPRRAGTDSQFFQGDEQSAGTLKSPSGPPGPSFTCQVPFSHSPGVAPAAARPGSKDTRPAFGPLGYPAGQTEAREQSPRRAPSPPRPRRAPQARLPRGAEPPPGYSPALERPPPGVVAGAPLRPGSPSGEASGTNQPPGVA